VVSFVLGLLALVGVLVSSFGGHSACHISHSC